MNGRYLDHNTLWGHDKTDPLMTKARFVEFVGQKAIVFDEFYDKNIPEQCKFWKRINEDNRNKSNYSYAR